MTFAPRGTLGGRLMIEPLDAERWLLHEPLRYVGERDEFIVPDGYVTDFATVPRIAVWLVPKAGLAARAAILHDYLLTDVLPSGRISSRDIDGLFRRAMRELGVPPVRRWVMWTGVRWGALFNRRRRAEWWKSAPLVLLLTLPMLIFAPAMILVAISLVPYGAAEFVATAPSRRKTSTGSLST